MKLIDKLKDFLGFERCIKCNKFIKRKDKKDGGVGYQNGKDFSYCIDCAKHITRTLLAGKKFKFPPIK